MAQILSFPANSVSNGRITLNESHPIQLLEELKDYSFMLDGLLSGMASRSRYLKTARRGRTLRRTARTPISY